VENCLHAFLITPAYYTVFIKNDSSIDKETYENDAHIREKHLSEDLPLKHKAPVMLDLNGNFCNVYKAIKRKIGFLLILLYHKM